jgi:hypothetical protein
VTARTDRRTFWGLAGDFFFFGIGSSFANQTTVVPAFLASLTTSAPLIGLASTLANGGWLLPQLFAANSLAGKRRRKMSVVVPAAIGRGVALLTAPAILLLAPIRPEFALAAFYLLYLAFWLTDAFASVAWLDLVGRRLTYAARARLIIVGTVAPGIVSIGVGVLVGIVLSSERLAFPGNYALLFGACGVCYTGSLISFLFVRDAPVDSVQPPLPWPEFFRRLASVLKGDKGFRRAVASQICVSAMGVAAPFYVVHGLEQLGFTSASIGIFTSVQVAGGVISSLILGMIGERRGARSVMRLWGMLAACGPLVALAAPALRAVLPAAVFSVYAVAFVVVGVQGNANMAGFLNWVLEHAPPSNRPMYIGIANTLSGISLVMPLVGGWLLSATGSYVVLFVVAAAGPLAGVLLTFGLPEPRHGLASASRS